MSRLPPVGGNDRGLKPDDRPHRLLILDSKRLVAEVLRHALLEGGLGSVDVATSPTEALVAARDGRPDLVILSARFTDRPDGGVLHAILSERPQIRVIVLVDQGESPPAPQTGVDTHGEVSMAAPASGFVSAIEEFLRGDVLPPTRVGSGSSEAHAGDAWIDSLTGREREVLHLLAGGATSEEIAARFGVKANTARKHVQNVLTKLQVHSRLEAVTVAMRKGIVRLADVDEVGSGSRERLPEPTRLT